MVPGRVKKHELAGGNFGKKERKSLKNLTVFRNHFILDEPRDFEGLEGRTFGVSNISLVITYVTVIIASLMLAGFLWVAFAYSGSGHRRKRRDAFYDDEGKTKNIHFLFLIIIQIFILDMAAKLHWINESFRKYQIEDVGCQLYVACEAGKLQGLNKHPKFGRLTTMIHKLIS